MNAHSSIGNRPISDQQVKCHDFVKHDAGKPSMTLIPPKAELAVARVLTAGAARYSRENWRKVEEAHRYPDAALRHINAYRSGEVIDSDFGERHLAHAICCLLFQLELDIEGSHVQR